MSSPAMPWSAAYMPPEETRTGAAVRKALGAAVALADFRALFAAVPTPVSIIATLVDGAPVGATVSAFGSLSAAPPLVQGSLDLRSGTLAAVRAEGRFGVSVLAADQAEVALTCASGAPDRWDRVPWEDVEGVPRIVGASAWMACDLYDELPGGDHAILVGRITAATTADVDPIVYHRRRFTAPIPPADADAG